MGKDLQRRLGRRIRQFRLRRDLSQEQLAERIGRTPASVSNLERGATLAPLDVLSRIAEELGVPLADFFLASRPSHGTAERRRMHERLFDAIEQLPTEDVAVALKIVEGLISLRGAPAVRRRVQRRGRTA